MKLTKKEYLPLKQNYKEPSNSIRYSTTTKQAFEKKLWLLS